SEASEEHKRIERDKLYALLGWCEVTRCRRAALLEYFGEAYPGDCGNCDVCLAPPRTWDGTTVGQMLLSCVYRTGQRFGAGHVIDVLRGNATDKVRQYRHERLSTFGIGGDDSVARWRSVVRQLIVQGFLAADPERFGALRLTARSRELLRGEVSLLLREETRPAARRAAAPGGGSGAGAAEHGFDQALWEALRACRKSLADEQGVPPFVIFHDSTLKE